MGLKQPIKLPNNELKLETTWGWLAISALRLSQPLASLVKFVPER
jgi:hypothetical protein